MVTGQFSNISKCQVFTQFCNKLPWHNGRTLASYTKGPGFDPLCRYNLFVWKCFKIWQKLWSPGVSCSTSNLTYLFPTLADFTKSFAISIFKVSFSLFNLHLIQSEFMPLPNTSTLKNREVDSNSKLHRCDPTAAAGYTNCIFDWCHWCTPLWVKGWHFDRV